MRNTLFLSLLLLLSACTAGKKISSIKDGFSPKLAFYNVENLFDLEDDPVKRDEDFTPTGRNEWTLERYQAKLGKLHQVIREMGYPSFLGVCEIENAAVLEAMSDSCVTETGKYDYVHFESLDSRGIDVALLYDPNVFVVSATEKITTQFPPIEGKEYTSRDILYVKGTYLKKHVLHLFVNHWPSRRGGLEKSEPRRLLVANNLKIKVSSILSTDPNASVFIMGDFNDEPDNKSITEILGAHDLNTKLAQNQLYNCTYPMDEAGLGTYNYRGNWNQLDQIIVSGNLLSGKSGLKVGEAEIFRKDWMMFVHEKYGETPSRTYGGPNYYGGYSDHLPVMIPLKN